MRTLMFCLIILFNFHSLPLASADDFTDGINAHKQQDYARAFNLWLPLADADHLLAQTLIGSMYAYGEGVTQDDAKAVKWFARAAKQGSAQAQYNLGIMYEKGLGVDKDLTLARKWLQAASDQGRKDASSLLTLISDAADAKLAQLPDAKPSTTVKETAPASTIIASNVEPIQVIEQEQADEELLGPPTITNGDALEPVTTTHNPQQGLDWLKNQPKDNFTIQLAASVEARLINAFIKQIELKQDYAHVISQRNDRDWHALVYGSFESSSVARKALKDLPEQWQVWQPWIRTVKSVAK